LGGETTTRRAPPANGLYWATQIAVPSAAIAVLVAFCALITPTVTAGSPSNVIVDGYDNSSGSFSLIVIGPRRAGSL
jgi:hypothetical protein